MIIGYKKGFTPLQLPTSKSLAHYVVEHRSLGFDLDVERFNVTFVARGGLKVKQLFLLTQDVVGSDIMFLDIGTND